MTVADEMTNYTVGSTAGKLPGDAVLSASQDGLGGMWLISASISDLLDRERSFISRFDGTWEEFQFGFAIVSMLDRRGNMWIGGQNVLGYYQKREGRWELARTFSHGPAPGWRPFLTGGEYSEEGFTIRTLFEDRLGTLWFGTGNGVTSYNLEDDNWRTHRPDSGVMDSVATVTIAQDVTGHMWFGTSKGLARLNVEDDMWVTDPIFEGEDVSTILRTDDGKMWVGLEQPADPGQQSIFRFELRNGNWQNVLDLVVGNVPNHKSLTTIYQSRDGSVWVGTSEQGVF
jgi:ligand-binding sensor domain-containing protein